MKNTFKIRFSFVLMIAFTMLFVKQSFAQVENVLVETYYIADPNDATDTTLGRSLEIGATTYRIYIDLKPGTKIRKIYGDANHTLRISSTLDFYNNIDRPSAVFGYQMNKSWFQDNPTLCLDSWLTLGVAVKQGTTNYIGIPKELDTDGSFIGGTNNTGGTAAIPGGILVNNEPIAGAPLTNNDGYITSTQTIGQWSDVGFKDMGGDDTTVFGTITIGNEFASNAAYLQQNNGVSGEDAQNHVLVAQLTTKGQISFELNIEVEQPNGSGGTEIKKYVADNAVLLPGEVLSPYLKYPPSCGCTDPNYLEYSPEYACNLQDSCKTQIVFGCMDPNACNYNPDANYNIPTLCCYPGWCNDRNLGDVCNSLSTEKIAIEGIYPVPVVSEVTFRFKVETEKDLFYEVYSPMGQLIYSKYLGKQSGVVIDAFNASSLATGLYMVRLTAGDKQETSFFSKF